MTQDTFNKIVTSVLLLFFMTMYILTWATGKTIDWNQLITFIVPGALHIAHLVSGTKVTTTNIIAKSATDVASINVGTPNEIQAIKNGGAKQ